MNPIPNDPSEISYLLVDHPKWGHGLIKRVRGRRCTGRISRAVILKRPGKPDRTFASMSEARDAMGVTAIRPGLVDHPTMLQEGARLVSASASRIKGAIPRVIDQRSAPSEVKPTEPMRPTTADFIVRRREPPIRTTKPEATEPTVRRITGKALRNLAYLVKAVDVATDAVADCDDVAAAEVKTVLDALVAKRAKTVLGLEVRL